MASYVPCKKNDANGNIFHVSLVSQANTKIFQVNPTLAAGDVKIAKDDGAPANLGTLPAVDGDFTKRVKVTLSQAETNADNLTIIFSDAAGSEWCDLNINIQTSAQTLDEVDTVADGVKAKTDNLPADPADDSDIDTQLADIKTEVDKIGTIPALDGGAQTIGAAIAKIADDNGGADYDAGTDSLQEIRDRGDAAWAGAPESVSGTIAVATADTIFDLTATLGTLSTVDDTYNDMIICILDNSGSVYETARITDYDGTGLTRITIDHELTFPVDDGVDTFVIYRAAYAPVGAASITEGDKNDIVDKLCDENVTTAHKTPGTAGFHIRRTKGRY